MAQIGLISAFEFDNVKTYDSITREVTINNCDLWLGVCLNKGEEIGKAKLNSELDVKVPAGKDRMVAEFTIYAYQDYSNALKEFIFKDLKNKGKEINKDYELKYFSSEEVVVNDYKTECNTKKEIPDGIFSKDMVCEEVLVGSHTEIIEEWIKITPADLKKNDVLRVGVFVDVELGEYVDWIPTIYGVEIEEWATYEGTGGTITEDGDFTIHTFTENGTFQVTGDNITNVSYLIVAGGGGGGAGGGGGGAGGLIYETNITLSAGNYTVVIGTGGTGGSGGAGHGDDGNNGTNSSFNSNHALGGGGGGGGIDGDNRYGFDGGSGGGGGIRSQDWYGGDGLDGQGYRGGRNINGGNYGTGGGGGASTEGMNASTNSGDGGNGTQYSINGTATYYAGGGGGGAEGLVETDAGSGGLGGGGDGGDDAVGSNARANSGSGGGGGGSNNYNLAKDAGNGSDGIVIIRYLTSGEAGDNVPVVTLNSPDDNERTYNTTITFNCTASDDINLVNVTFYLNGSVNGTNTDGTNNTAYTFERTLEIGSYNWTCQACDNSTNCTTATTRDLTIAEEGTWSESYEVGLQNWFSFEETSGTDVMDYMDNHNGTSYNMTLMQDGNYNYSYGLYDRTARFTLPSSARITSGDSLYSFWIKTNETGEYHFFNDATSAGWGRSLKIRDGKIVLNMYSGSDYMCGVADTFETTSNISNYSWNYIYVGLEGDYCVIAVNNVVEGNVSAGSTTTRDGDPSLVRYGDTGEGGTWQSPIIQLDEWATYTRPLSADERSEIYAGLTPYSSGGGEAPSDNYPTATLVSPVDYYNTTSRLNSFNCKGSDDINLTTLKMFINNNLLHTWDNPENDTNKGLETNSYIVEGLNNWTCEACDNSSQCTNASVRYFTVDTLYPTLDVNLVNSTIYSYGVNQTLNFTIIDTLLDTCWYNYNDTNTTFSCTNGSNAEVGIPVQEGYTDIIVYANDTLGRLNYSETLSFSFDSVAPNVTILAPANNSVTSSGYVNSSSFDSSINVSISDANLDTCWYYNETGNTTFTCTNNITLSSLESGTYTYIIYANDTLGNLAEEDVTFTLEYDLLENNITYETPVVEGENNQFQINLQYDSSKWLGSASLVYNGTSYAANNLGSGNNLIFSRNLSAPSVTTDTNYSFYWNMGLTNATGTYYYNSTSFTQLVKNNNMSETGSPYTTPFINFTAYDEQTLIEMNATLSLTIDYKIKGGSVTNTFSFSNTSENESRWSFALSPSDETYIVDMTLEVGATNYTQKFYNFQGLELTNTTTSYGLYLLPDDDSTSFIVSVRDENYFPLVVEVYVQRYYPSLNQWYTTEVLETNDAGATTQHFFTEDALYRFKIYEDGALIHTTESTLIYCEETPCSVEIIVPDTFQNVLEEFEPLDDLTTTMTYSNTTQDVTFTYIDTSTDFTQGRLNVIFFHFGNSSTTPVCNTTSSSSTAVMTCDLTGQINGTYVASGYITRSDETLVERISLKKILSIVENVGLDGVLWSLFILVGIMMMGVYRPSLAIIFGSVGVVLLSMLQLISIPMTAIVAIVGIALILLIGVKRE